ncbi:hypothetical protein BKA69DRAFT_1029291 [Paraphysoderma sedebokerense]|nr:hypothetical protein BKA69DRAFT_1029291 [Paraphysoderma sedebokerense]
MLHDVLISKRSRSVPLTSLEPLTLKFVDLCVTLRKGRVAKEGLHAYKNVAQNTSVSSIEKIIKRFIEGAEAKLKEAQAQAKGKVQGEKDAVVDVEDLETPETPESILLSTVSGDDAKDRTDREVVMPWLKFLWESYRTTLEVLRNNARLEVLYQTVAQWAFKFCKTYSRKTEFRRLADTLRSHLTSIPKSSHQPHSISLSDPEVLQRYLDTRFIQLSTATDLELWQEGFKSIEDVYQLLILAGKMMTMLAGYYEKLTEIFAVGGDGLFLAASWNRYFAWINSMKTSSFLSEDDMKSMAANVLLSALAVPVINTTPTTTFTTATTLSDLIGSPNAASELDTNLVANKSLGRKSRLAVLLGLSKIPSRNALIKEAMTKNVLNRVPAVFLQLHDALEVNFHPLTAAQKVGPLLAELEKSEEWKKYVPEIKNVMIAKVLKEVSQFYTTISIDSLINLVSVPGEPKTSLARIEKFIVQANKRSHLRIRMNHLSQTFEFESDSFVSATYLSSVSRPIHADPTRPSINSTPLDKFKYTLSALAKKLHTVTHLIDPSKQEAVMARKRDQFVKAREAMEEEHKAALARKHIIERKKEIIETIQLRKEKEEQREKFIRMQQEAEAAKIKMEAEKVRREKERIQRERDEIAKEEARKMAESLKEKTGVIIKEEDLQNLDTRAIMNLQIEQIEREKAEQKARLTALGKRIDYLERAYRKEEIPLLDKDYENQKKYDRQMHVESRRKAIEDALRKHEEAVSIKKRVERMVTDWEGYKNSIEERKQAELEEREKEAEIKIREEKRKRREAVRQELAAYRERVKMEEEERIRREEEEERRREEEHKRIEGERLAREKEEYEAKRQQLDELAARQRAREEEIERKRLEREREAAVPERRPVAADTWRRAEPAAPAGGRYVPPSRRTVAGGAAPSWRDRVDREREEESRGPSAGAYVPPSARRSEPGKYVPPTRRSEGPPSQSFRDEEEGNSGAGGRYVPPSRRSERPTPESSRDDWGRSAPRDNSNTTGGAWRRSNAGGPSREGPGFEGSDRGRDFVRRDREVESRESTRTSSPVVENEENEDGFTVVSKVKKVVKK